MARRAYLLPLVLCVAGSCSTDAPTAIDAGAIPPPVVARIADDEHEVISALLLDATDRILGGVAEDLDASAPNAAFALLSAALEARDRAAFRQQLDHAGAVMTALEKEEAIAAARPDIESLRLHLARMDAILTVPATPSATPPNPQEHE